MLTNTVDVQATDLHDVQIDTGSLAASELMHVARLESTQAHAHLVARSWLRHALAGYLAVEPDEISLRMGVATGLRMTVPATDLTFSFDHSDEVATLAVSFRRPVGVAVERLADGGDVPSIERSSLSTHEYGIVSRSHDPLRTFHKLSVRRRALLRAAAVSGLPTDADVSGLSPVSIGGFEVVDLYLGNDVVAAVATPSGMCLDVALDLRAPTEEPTATALHPVAVAG